jgi:hypothetical protein
VQNSVKMAIDKFAEHVHAGLHLEKLTRCKDDRIRTIRVDQSWRGVVLAPDAGDTYSLIRVMPHDKAIEYAASHRFTVNEALGVVEVRDEAAIEQRALPAGGRPARRGGVDGGRAVRRERHLRGRGGRYRQPPPRSAPSATSSGRSSDPAPR